MLINTNNNKVYVINNDQLNIIQNNKPNNGTGSDLNFGKLWLLLMWINLKNSARQWLC